jgi:2-(1,2-epoxy-1,2-dihydrophenyl)acetyl-CoA isomerase
MSSILLSIENNIAVITLNRPEKFNAFNKEMAYLLQQTFTDISNNKAIRAVLLTGAGKAFCAGQDLAEATSEAFPGFVEVVSKHYNPIIKQIRELPLPVIAAVNGVAAGAGANIALAADIVFAADNASFVQAFSKIGLVPDSGGTFILPRLIGIQRATALMFSGDKLNATDAANMGMIYKCVPTEDLQNKAMEYAQKLATMPTKGIALTKQLLNESATNNLNTQLQRECDLQFAAGNTADYKEGVNAFLEKRNPNFKGE